MSPKSKRKYDREQKQKVRIEADLEPERLLKQEMDLVKRKVGPALEPYIERVRGYVLVEGKESEPHPYELICNFNEISLRPLKNL